MAKGNIIFMNGVSSAGKTTLAKALQNALPEPYFLLGNDIFTDEMAPDKFKETDWPELEYQAMSMMIKTIRLFSDEGKHVIVDSVLLTVMKNDLLRECVNLLYQHPLVFVRVNCSSLDELLRREKQRGDRDIGQGASQLAILTPQDIYDITIDTYTMTTEQCVERIIQGLEQGKPSEAFGTLYREYSDSHYKVGM